MNDILRQSNNITHSIKSSLKIGIQDFRKVKVKHTGIDDIKLYENQYGTIQPELEFWKSSLITTRSALKSKHDFCVDNNAYYKAFLNDNTPDDISYFTEESRKQTKLTIEVGDLMINRINIMILMIDVGLLDPGK